MIRVLVVDDDFRVLQVHAAYVEAVPGFVVAATARTAAEARQVLATDAIDLVLLDNYLPDRLGSVLIQELAGRVDVIMVTADNSAESVRACLGAGALNYLLKPFAADALAARLRAYERYRSRLRGALTQERIDASYALLHEGDAPPTPKGRSPVTARLVREVFTSSGVTVTAASVAEALGISRPTAQRYLSAMSDEGVVVVAMRYGSTGRPEHVYRLRG